MRIPVLGASLLLIGLSTLAAPAQKPADVAQKEEAYATAKKAFGEAERGIRGSYESMERALLAARGEQGATWRAEMKRVLEGLSAAAVTAVQKKGGRPQIQALFKRESPAALKKIENKDLLLFEPILAARLTAVGSEVPLDAAKLEAGSLADLALLEILGKKPFHEYWNDAFADAMPAADAYRIASQPVVPVEPLVPPKLAQHESTGVAAAVRGVQSGEAVAQTVRKARLNESTMA